MSTYSSQRQSRTSGENPAAPTSRAIPTELDSAQPECPVLLRLPDVSRPSIEEGFRHTTPLEMQSAMETIGAAPFEEDTTAIQANEDLTAAALPPKALTGAAPLQASILNANEQSFASLLAASPAFHRTAQPAAERAAQQVSKPVASSPVSPVPSAKPEPVIEPAAESQAASVAEETHETSTKAHRTDKPAIKPVRRTFRVYRPLWMPEVPPTLLLGVLICSSALLVGMLWRGNKAEFQEIVIPAKEDADSAADPKQADQTPRMAEVPEMPEVPAVPTKQSEQPLKTAKKTPAPEHENLPTEAQSQTPGTTVATTPAEEAQEISQNSGPSQPSAEGMNLLPPVESAPQNNFYGQTLGGPPPHIVNNPHVGNPSQADNIGPNQGPIYEARRPAAEFRGMITKPDSTDHHGRY